MEQERIEEQGWNLPCCQCTETCFHVPSTQNDIYTPVQGASSPVENRSCSESTRCCVQYVIPFSWYQSIFDGLAMAEWLGLWTPQWAAFETGLRLVKQFTHNWDLLCCQCTETCFHASFIQSNFVRQCIIRQCKQHYQEVGPCVNTCSLIMFLRLDKDLLRSLKPKPAVRMPIVPKSNNIMLIRSDIYCGITHWISVYLLPVFYGPKPLW